MARTPKDPNPEFNQMPEMTIETVDYNMFYKPERANVSEGLVQLSKSLSSIVPSLTNFSITEEIKDKEKSQAQAINDYNANKADFASLVKSGKIPEGANPHYFNKMMELDLANKARKFKNEFDTFTSGSNLVQSLTPNAWSEVYETKLKEFYERENLANYDPIALGKAFFNTTSAFRNEREQQFSADRMAYIKKNTENNAIKNYSGIFIEAQMDNLTTEDLFKKIKDETASFISLGTDGTRANDLFIAGFKKYLDVINDQEGFDYARSVLDDMENLKLGTGYFAGEKGSRRRETVRLSLLDVLTEKELDFKDKRLKLKNINEDTRKSNLTDEFFRSYNEPGFNLGIFLNTTVIDENDEFKPKYSNKDKIFFKALNEGINKSIKVTESSLDALTTLDGLTETNPYGVRDKALEFAINGELTTADYLRYSNNAGKDLVYKQNIFFLQSKPFQDYMPIFKDKYLATNPEFAVELNFIKARFTDDLLEWHTDNKDEDKYIDKPTKYQKDFDAEVKASIGEALSNSVVIRGNYEFYRKIFFDNYNIILPQPTGQ